MILSELHWQTHVPSPKFQCVDNQAQGNQAPVNQVLGY